MLYFALFVLFLALIIGPVFASKYLKSLPSIPLDLLQPTGLNNNDTSAELTGSALNNQGAPGATGGAAASASASS